MAGILGLESLLGLPFPGSPPWIDGILHRLANSPHPAGNVYDFLVDTFVVHAGVCVVILEAKCRYN
jgi:hypothetical protein